MGVNMGVKVVAFAVAWALFATALPSNGGNVAGVSPIVSPSPSLPSLQANCTGNSPGCDGGYCPPTITNIKTIVDAIDDNREFDDSGMIACHRCATQQDRPADYRQGICIYAKFLHGKKITGKMLKDSVAGLMKNNCGKCGSIEIDGIPDGQIKVNFMRDSCETGACPQKPTKDAVDAPRYVNAPQKKSLDHMPHINPRQDDPIVAVPQDDCKGSGFCKTGPCKPSIHTLKGFVDQINPEKQYSSGQQVACFRCGDIVKDGFCVFPQGVSQRTVSAAEVKETLQKIISNGCERCGSAGLTRGQGTLTVNHSTGTCGHGACGLAESRRDLISPRQDDLSSAKPLISRDCKGSGLCKTNCAKTNIGDLQYYIDKIDEKRLFGDGEQIACVRCNHRYESGLCVFLQKLDGKSVTGKQVKDTFRKIVQDRCKNCGSAPLLLAYAKGSLLTINYTTSTCRHGICRSANTRQDDPNSTGVSRRGAASVV